MSSVTGASSFRRRRLDAPKIRSRGTDTQSTGCVGNSEPLQRSFAPDDSYDHLGCTGVVQAHPRPDRCLLFRHTVLPVALAAAPHDEQVAAGGHKDSAPPAAVRPDEKAACGSQTEHRDDRGRRQIRRTVGMPRGAIAIIAIPIHPDPVIRHVAIIAEHSSYFGEKRRSGGEVVVLVCQPRLIYLAVIHPASP